ncbi:MAG: HIT family protein [Desulfobulbaceae bacterium]|nr:HIT family protein [Desulfobulbaceae bacterium]
MSDPNCIFCKILQGDLPYKFYENEAFLGILDVNPLVTGHSLLIPKNHYADAREFPEEVASLYMPSIQKIIAILETNIEGVCDFTVCQSIGKSAFQTVPHGHSHIIPRWPNDIIGPLPVDRAWPVQLRSPVDVEWARSFIEKVSGNLH